MIFKLLPSLPTQKTKLQIQLEHLLQTCILNQTQNFHLKEIHAHSITSGLSRDVFFSNLLLKAYSSYRIRDARNLLDQMPKRNIISWSTMISTYTHLNKFKDTFFLFQEYRKWSFESPNEYIIASVLKACKESNVIEHMFEVHGLVIKTGYFSDVFVGTSLINCYCKIGLMDEVLTLLDELPVKNSVTWTSVLSGFSQVGRSDVSLKLINTMRDSGVEPDMFVISSVIKACADLECLEYGKQVHGYSYRNGMQMDVSVNNVLIDLYCKCSDVKVGRRVFNSIDMKNLVSWTTMISGYMQNSLDKEAMSLFVEMSRLGWKVDVFACTSILSSCASLLALKQGKQVHGYIIKTNLELDNYVKNGLVDMYSKCDSQIDARVVFDYMEEHDVVSYNTMIEGYAGKSELKEAVFLFNEMRRSNILSPSLLTFVSLLGLSSSLSLLDLSKQAHTLIVKCGVHLDLKVGSALIDVYSKCSCVHDARVVFNEMDEKDLVVWNAMISGYTRNKEGEVSLMLYKQLLLRNLRPDELTFVALVMASSEVTSIFYGLQIHNQIIKSGLEDVSLITNSLIDMYAKCGCIEDSRAVFNSTCSGCDVACWNSMISRYAHHGHSNEALEIFRLMIEEKIEPNYITYVGVLSACVHVGLVEEGLYHFNAMKQVYEIEPGMEHYASVVNLLGRIGKLKEAIEFIQQMTIEPAVMIWRSLLSACREFGNVELGRYAADMAICRDPNDAGPYVLMSNLYASKGMWSDVENLRKEIESMGSTKGAGYSWIEQT